MQDITELQRRIGAALDRIGTGIDAIQPGTSDAGADADGAAAGDPRELAEALEAERALTAQLEARLETSRSAQESSGGEAQAEIARLKAQVTEIEEDRDRLKAANDALRDSNRALRDANEAGLADAGLVNEALKTELDALRQVRASDRSELDQIIGVLGPALDGKNEQEGAHDA